MNLDKLKDILKVELGDEIYYSLKEAEELLQINLDDVEFIEISITEKGKSKKTKFVNKNNFDRFVDNRELSEFNKLLKQASKFNPNENKK